jgi:hypothetical protein
MAFNWNASMSPNRLVHGPFGPETPAPLMVLTQRVSQCGGIENMPMFNILAPAGH